MVAAFERWQASGSLPKGWPHYVHMVRCHEFLVRLRINTLPVRKHFLETAGRHAEQQYARLRSGVLKRVRSIARDKDKRPSGCAHDTFAHFEVELTAHNVTELSFHRVQVGRRTALRRESLAKDAGTAA